MPRGVGEAIGRLLHSAHCANKVWTGMNRSQAHLTGTGRAPGMEVGSGDGPLSPRPTWLTPEHAAMPHASGLTRIRRPLPLASVPPPMALARGRQELSALSEAAPERYRLSEQSAEQQRRAHPGGLGRDGRRAHFRVMAGTPDSILLYRRVYLQCQGPHAQ